METFESLGSTVLLVRLNHWVVLYCRYSMHCYFSKFEIFIPKKLLKLTIRESLLGDVLGQIFERTNTLYESVFDKRHEQKLSEHFGLVRIRFI